MSLQLRRRLAQLRSAPAFRRGAMRLVSTTDGVISFTRHCTGHASFLVALNLGVAEARHDHAVLIRDRVYRRGLVVVASRDVGLTERVLVKLKDLLLAPGDALVIRLEK